MPSPPQITLRSQDAAVQLERTWRGCQPREPTAERQQRPRAPPARRHQPPRATATSIAEAKQRAPRQRALVMPSPPQITLRSQDAAVQLERAWRWGQPREPTAERQQHPRAPPARRHQPPRATATSAAAAGVGDAGSTADDAEVARAQGTVEDGAEDTGARGAAAGGDVGLFQGLCLADKS